MRGLEVVNLLYRVVAVVAVLLHYLQLLDGQILALSGDSERFVFELQEVQTLENLRKQQYHVKTH